MGTDFRRPITPTERLYFSTRQVTPPFIMQLAVPGTGTLAAAELQRAVDAASAANPGSRLVAEGERWVDSGVGATVRVVPDRTLDYRALEHDEELNRPLGPTPERTTEVLLLTGDPVTVVFRAFHGVMDGMGLRLWIDDVFRALRGEPLVGAPDPIADAELVARLGVPGKPTLVVPRYRAATGRGRQDPAAPRWLLRHRTVEANGRAVVARICAILAEHTRGASRFMIPVDLRRHDPALRSTGNLALPLFLDVRPGTSWQDVSARMRAGLSVNQELNEMDNGGLSRFPKPMVRSVLRGANWLGARAGRNMVSATVSHMGTVDTAALATPTWRPTTMRILPQHSGAMPLLFGILAVDDRLEITVSCRNGAGIEPRLEALLDTLAARLTTELAEAPAA